MCFVNEVTWWIRQFLLGGKDEAAFPSNQMQEHELVTSLLLHGRHEFSADTIGCRILKSQRINTIISDLKEFG